MSRDRSPLSAANLPWLEELHEAWQRDHGAVDGRWDELFRQEEAVVTETARAGSPDIAQKQGQVDRLIHAFRDVGYLYAHLNPLAPEQGEEANYYTEPTHTYAQLTLEGFGLTEGDLDTEFSTAPQAHFLTAPQAHFRTASQAHFSPDGVLSASPMKLSSMLEALRETYCGSIGVEFLHIQNKPMRRWLIREMESRRNRPSLDPTTKRIILEDLMRAEEFEHFMHSSFVGQKRFSLEGAEAVIPALHHVVDIAPSMGIRDLIVGMTHRGRLTVLNRILGKPLEEVFSEFEGHEDPGDYGGSGDVRYHLGYSKDHESKGSGTVKVNLVANPSHLESVGPVVQGMARAVQRERDDRDRRIVVPIVLHGDAAFSGQGVVAETFNLANLKGYKTGGTVHIVINNQIGFTTSSRDARSSFFSTDVARMLPVPVFHVNGDDAEAVVYTVDLALRFRMTFGRDAVVDIFCYRKYGHNEGDDPSFTHPLMYRIIERKKSPQAIYGERCRGEGIVSSGEEEQARIGFRGQLRAALQAARAQKGLEAPKEPPGRRPETAGEEERIPAPPEELLREIARKITAQPPGFRMHPKLKRIVEEKASRLEREGTVDWAFAESLAFGTLLTEGVPIRLSGQDSARGTFSQRHLVWWDMESLLPQPYTPLAHVPPTEIQFSVYDSPLSEYSVLGFEYGFTLGRPRALVIWEAQFGDFSNGAQVIIDNYVAGGEAKWGTESGIVLLLPHGFEGQGPEHSSGHLERFLLLCARDNMQVCNCTTPAQYFHLLRRQGRRRRRKPLVVLTPKSLLRHPAAVSPLAELSKGRFLEVLDDPLKPRSPRRVILCSGKIFYDLQAQRVERKDSATAVVRIEQLFPFPSRALAEVLKSYEDAAETVWVQEEPRNRGAWMYMKEMVDRTFPGMPLAYIGRAESASPATGSHSRHEREQRELIAAALSGEPGSILGK